MSKRILTGVMVGLAASLSLATAVRASTKLSFDDIDISPNPYGHYVNNLFYGGLHFTDEAFTVMPVGLATFPNNTVSQFLEVGSSPEVGDPLVIMLANGGAFDLRSLRLGLGDGNVTADFDEVVVTGHKAADCQVACDDPMLTLRLGYDWATFDLRGFTDLSSVTFGQQMTRTGDQLALDFGWLALDDVTYALPGEAVAVPEPAAWAMMLAGFAGVGAMIRRSRRNPAPAATA